MEKLRIIVLLMLMSSVLGRPKISRVLDESSSSTRIDESPEEVEKWFKTLPKAKEKTTKLHFYFHDILSGKNPSAITVAQSTSTPKSLNSFGTVNIMDDALTVGPESNSTVLGHARGMYSVASKEEVGLYFSGTFVFSSGPYNGSTLSVLGHNSVLNNYRQMPVVGGTGKFKMARGMATAHTIWFDAKTGDAVVEYHVVARHY